MTPAGYRCAWTPFSWCHHSSDDTERCCLHLGGTTERSALIQSPSLDPVDPNVLPSVVLLAPSCDNVSDQASAYQVNNVRPPAKPLPPATKYVNLTKFSRPPAELPLWPHPLVTKYPRMTIVHLVWSRSKLTSSAMTSILPPHCVGPNLHYHCVAVCTRTLRPSARSSFITTSASTHQDLSWIPAPPPLPTDIRNFPELTLGPSHEPPALPMNEYFLDQVAPVQCTISTVGIMEDDGFRFRILSVCSGYDCYFAAMIEGGANVGMVPNEDNLVDVHTISPVKVALALS